MELIEAQCEVLTHELVHEWLEGIRDLLCVLGGNDVQVEVTC